MTSNTFVTICKLSTSNGVPLRSGIVALVVGTILTLINQGNLIFSGQQPNWWKVALTFLVPYCVATYGAVSSQLAAIKKSKSNPQIQQQQQQQQTPSQPDNPQNPQNEFYVELQLVTSATNSEISHFETETTKSGDFKVEMKEFQSV